MPEYGAYLRGFGIWRNIILANYRLVDYTISHEEVRRFREYNYDVVLTFYSKANNYKKLLAELTEQTEKSRIIDTRFGNPYRCWFGKPKIIKIILKFQYSV